MLIKLIPETDAEKKKLKTVEHYNVREFLIFGTKKDPDGDIVDFHDWSGSYRYLIGSLDYFHGKLSAEENGQSSRQQEITFKPEIVSDVAGSKKGLVKTGDAGPITQVIDAKELEKIFDEKKGNVVRFPGKKTEGNVEEVVPDRDPDREEGEEDQENQDEQADQEENEK